MRKEFFIVGMCCALATISSYHSFKIKQDIRLFKEEVRRELAKEIPNELEKESKEVVTTKKDDTQEISSEIEDLVAFVYQDNVNLANSVKAYIGSSIQDFELFKGEDSYFLSDFGKKPYILDIMSTDCPSCRLAEPILKAFSKDKDIEVISVSYHETREELDGVTKAEGFETSHLFTVCSETDLVGMYSLEYVPSLFFVNAEGIIEFVLIGSVETDTLNYLSKILFDK